MKNIAIIFGGGSCENDVSIITGIQAFNNIDKQKYKVYAIYLTDNKFYLINKPTVEHFVSNTKKIGEQVVFCANKLCCVNKKSIKNLAQIDCALLCTHGGIGENGSLQGYLEVCGIPYTCGSVEVSSIGMSKTLSKIMFESLGICVLPYVSFSSKDERKACVDNAVKKLGLPIIVKPNSQGSSIGIEVAKTVEELSNAVDVAFEYDERIILEAALTNFDEYNCAVMNNNDDIVISSLEQPTKWQDYLSFEDKYMGFGKMSCCERIFPAKCSQEVKIAIHSIAMTIYQYLYINGIVRMDFLVDKDSGSVYINEINTIPGSLAFYLFSDKNMDMSAVIDALISQAIHDYNCRLRPLFRCELLNKYYKTNSNACKISNKII